MSAMRPLPPIPEFKRPSALVPAIIIVSVGILLVLIGFIFGRAYERRSTTHGLVMASALDLGEEGGTWCTLYYNGEVYSHTVRGTDTCSWTLPADGSEPVFNG